MPTTDEIVGKYAQKIMEHAKLPCDSTIQSQCQLACIKTWIVLAHCEIAESLKIIELTEN
jgi:hypothetical protein